MFSLIVRCVENIAMNVEVRVRDSIYWPTHLMHERRVSRIARKPFRIPLTPELIFAPDSCLHLRLDVRHRRPEGLQNHLPNFTFRLYSHEYGNGFRPRECEIQA